MAGNEAAGASFKGWQAIFNSHTISGRTNVSPRVKSVFLVPELLTRGSHHYNIMPCTSICDSDQEF